jgi:hypothetical protein
MPTARKYGLDPEVERAKRMAPSVGRLQVQTRRRNREVYELVAVNLMRSGAFKYDEQLVQNAQEISVGWASQEIAAAACTMALASTYAAQYIEQCPALVIAAMTTNQLSDSFGAYDPDRRRRLICEFRGVTNNNPKLAAVCAHYNIAPQLRAIPKHIMRARDERTLRITSHFLNHSEIAQLLKDKTPDVLGDWLACVYAWDTGLRSIRVDHVRWGVRTLWNTTPNAVFQLTDFIRATDMFDEGWTLHTASERSRAWHEWRQEQVRTSHLQVEAYRAISRLEGLVDLQPLRNLPAHAGEGVWTREQAQDIARAYRDAPSRFQGMDFGAAEARAIANTIHADQVVAGTITARHMYVDAVIQTNANVDPEVAAANRKRYEEAYQRLLHDEYDFKGLPLEWETRIALGPYRFVALNSRVKLEEEGARMQHCVGSYSQRVWAGQTFIYSVQKFDKDSNDYHPAATLEIRPEGNSFTIGQFKTFKNHVPSPAAQKAAREFILHIRETVKPPQPAEYIEHMTVGGRYVNRIRVR